PLVGGRVDGRRGHHPRRAEALRPGPAHGDAAEVKLRAARLGADRHDRGGIGEGAVRMDESAATTPTAAVADVVDVTRIMQMIPHRYPFLLIDRVVDIVAGESATGIKNVSINENYFQGHFPRDPVMPGVLIIEAMAQTAAVLVVYTLG